MKKIFLIFSILLVISQIGFGQSEKIKIELIGGDLQKVAKRSTLQGVIGHDKDGVYALKGVNKVLKTKDYLVEYFDNKMNLIKSVPLKLKYKKNDMQLEFILYSNDKIYVFTSFVNKKTNKNYLFKQTLNKKTLMVNNDMEKISEISFGKKNTYYHGMYDFRLSPDDSKILVYHALPSKTKVKDGAKGKVSLHVFDKDFNKLWNKNITITHPEKYSYIRSYRIDDSSNVHILSKLKNIKKKKGLKSDPGYYYYVLSYLRNEDQLIENPIKFEDKFFKNMKISINKKGELLCAGVYNTKKNVNIRGLGYVKIDIKNKKILSQSFNEYTTEYINERYEGNKKDKINKKIAKGKDLNLLTFYIDEIVTRSDGGVVLIAEDYYTTTRTTTSTDSQGNMKTKTTTYYHYDNILVMSISPDGKLDWTREVSKEHVTSNTRLGLFSYGFTAVDDKLYFVFNDHYDNISNLGYTEESKAYSGSKKCNTVLFSIDFKGNLTKQALPLPYDKNTVFVKPTYLYEFSDHEFILFGDRKKVNRFIKVLIK